MELVSTTDSYTSLEPGDRGTVTGVDVDKPPIVRTPTRKYWIDWDDGGHLAMVQGEDRIKKIEESEPIEVPKDDLITVMEFVADDPALDHVPEELHPLVGAIERIEQELPEEYHGRFANTTD